MKIYVTHSKYYDFENELYKPLRESKLSSDHDIKLPHENSLVPFNSREYMKNCDLIVAEVSFPATGQGIELGWADMYSVPIVCIYKKGSKLANSLKVISKTFIEYETKEDLITKLSECINSFEKK